jgi:DNA-binding response OmpR family regulator
MASPPRPTVVILDDEQRAREMLRRSLERYGYETVETATVRDAISALRRGSASAAILDVRLPEEQTGLDVLSQFRREAPEAKVPVIILTGSLLSDEEEAEITRQRGFLFLKPESLESLMKFLDQLLERDQPQ